MRGALFGDLSRELLSGPEETGFVQGDWGGILCHQAEESKEGSKERKDLSGAVKGQTRTFGPVSEIRQGERGRGRTSGGTRYLPGPGDRDSEREGRTG